MSLNVEKTTWHKKYPFQNNMPMYIYFFLLAKKNEQSNEEEIREARFASLDVHLLLTTYLL